MESFWKSILQWYTEAQIVDLTVCKEQGYTYTVQDTVLSLTLLRQSHRQLRRGHTTYRSWTV